ncbi:MAG TPA: DUF3556 domain-containing protein [Solirubrobacterales bacterium]|nr:DUF3556 domain-containing protein [Solirubrobacterales bacterium]
MSFLQPSPPPFDLDEWKAKPFLSRLKPVVQEWAVEGFGAPGVIYLLYAVKLVVFVGGAALLISATTPGLGGLGDIGEWWTEPIVFQKAAVWTMLWEILGLGSGSMALAARYTPPIGGVLYRLRPGTVRLAPWPDEVPLTGGTRRTLADVALYVGVLGAAVYLLFSDGESFAGTAAGRLDPTAIAVLLGLLVLLGLRDKVSFLSARPEVYGFLLVVSLFPVENFIVGWQFVFFFIWWGAASSKFNRHFPFVIAVMSSNTPWNRSHNAKAKMYVNYPDDIRPSRFAAFMAHLGTAIELGLPLVLLLTAGGPIALIALIGMIIFHANITSTFALGVPLEWNLFMIFGLLFLFGEYGDVPLSTLDDPLLIIVLGVIGVLIPVAGNLRPDKVSFLPGMRYYAGNWATSLWLFRKDSAAEDKLDREICRVAPVVVEQLAKLYGDETAEYLMAKGVAFRAMHSHGRALLGLLPRAVDDVDRYHVREGELVSGVVNGWNFGDGHFHNEQLLEAVQERCGFEEGDLRVVVLESQPAHVQRQRYRICDAASGLVEEGWVEVADMLERGPWLEESWDFPVEVTRRGGDRSAHPAIA